MISGSTENLDAVTDSDQIIKVNNPADFQAKMESFQANFNKSS